MSIWKKAAIYHFVCLVVFGVARIVLLILYNEHFGQMSAVQFLEAFIHGIRFDLSSATAFFCIPLLLMLFPVSLARSPLWQKGCSLLLFIVLIGLLVALAGDIAYFDFVKRHLTYEFLFLGNFNELKTTVFMVLGSYLPILIALGAAGWILFRIWKWISSFDPVDPVRRVDYGLYVAAVLLMAIYVRGGLGSKPIGIIDAYASGSTKTGNLVMNGVFSMSHSVLKTDRINHHFFEEQQALEIVSGQTAGTLPENPFQQTSALSATGYNLVFVLVESLSYKYLDQASGGSFGVTPNLDRLAREGMLFTRFYANGQRSVEGIQATLAGIPAIVGMPTLATGLVVNHSRLGRMAGDNGYSTAFLQSSKRRSLRIDSIAGSAGFKEYYGMEDMPVQLDYPDPKSSRWGWDYEMLMKAADRMEEMQKPFLVYAITSTTHTPYPRPPGDLEKYPHHTNNEAGFLNTLHYTDWSIGQFLDRIRDRPWFKKTIFVFTADHALAHYRTGGFTDRFHIPLIIYAPDIFKPAVNDTVASQVDLLPTIIEMLGLQGSYSSFGRSILKPGENRPALVREGSVAGVITDRGFLRHSLKNRLEFESFKEKLPASHFDDLEKRLLASDQLVHKLITANRWYLD